LGAGQILIEADRSPAVRTVLSTFQTKGRFGWHSVTQSNRT
jgi:hypothetical protein